AKQLNRNYIGYELYENYKPLIEKKLDLTKRSKQNGKK
ncbi:MAG: site-specific DNA-methyltransferase, partial [Clostridia bacterium]|nr:site-specific DNA-methyltransferase [Clostridia bacterium]